MKLSTTELINALKNLFLRENNKEMTSKQVVGKLKIKNDRPSVQKKLDDLVKEGYLASNAEDRYWLNRKDTVKSTDAEGVYEGVVDMTKTGAAYVICTDIQNDIYINSKKINGALDKDTVQVKVTYLNKKGKPEGEIIAIIKRDTDHFLGTIKISKQYAFLIPDKLNMPVDIFIPLENIGDAKDEDKVVVKIINWASDKVKSPKGKVVSVLGKSGSSDIEMKSILVNNGFNLDFDEKTIEESESYFGDITEEEVKVRRDFRGITTITIDPLTAKDFDDAISIHKDENDQTVIGVHIADVTHFVKEGSALDKEAFERSTSVYLVDRVLPMLPERLSNELCSLRPNEDKYTFSAVFTFDKNNKVINRWFGKTIIHSNRRFTYEEAQEILETGEGDFAVEVLTMNRIAESLREERFKKGSIDFDSDEIRFELDENGTPIALYKKVRKASNMLVEEYMLLANKEVAYYVSHIDKNDQIPMVFRVHDLPDPDRVQEFAAFASQLGQHIKVDTPEQVARSYNFLAKLAKENPAFKMLEPMAIRTMAKAVYSAKNIGHYGLGFEYYTHFTSPIRRYSDVLVHRILFDNLGKSKRLSATKLEEQCQHISGQEKRATIAERESVKYKQVEYLKEKIGETFDGVVNGMIERGFFVELTENFCEGMVSFESLDDAWTVDESKFFATAHKSKKTIRMGDRVRVAVVNADLKTRKIDFSLVIE